MAVPGEREVIILFEITTLGILKKLFFTLIQSLVYP
jgi:hypothetical protein